MCLNRIELTKNEGVEERPLALKLDRTGSDTCRYYLPAVWPGASCLTYLSPGHYIEMKRVILSG